MLEYSANNQTFHRSKIECLNWLGMRDSNPRSRDQNPVPYRLANPQCEIDYSGFLPKLPGVVYLRYCLWIIDEDSLIPLEREGWLRLRVLLCVQLLQRRPSAPKLLV